MSFSTAARKVFKTVHRWLGFASGLVVFIVAVTGAIWVFESEISDLFYDYRKVEQQDRPFVSVAHVREISAPYLDHINSLYFLGADRCLTVRQWTKHEGVMQNKYLHLNPYTGEILAKQLEGRSFFDWVLELHMHLLLGEVGGQIVRYATLVFLFIIFTGIYLWWPRNRPARKQRFSFRWRRGVSRKRKNYDLHAILGFYASWVILFAVLTGLAWSFQWVDRAIYFVATAGEPYRDYSSYASPSPRSMAAPEEMDDIVLQKAIDTYGKPYDNIWFYPPLDGEEAYYVYVNPSPTTFYSAEAFYFDQRSGDLLAEETAQTLNNGEQLRKAYYDIHLGKILGLPGQLLMLFASLIVASLPLTGFYMWYSRGRAGRGGGRRGSADCMV